MIIIDRFEDGSAVLEDGDLFRVVDRSAVCESAKEGDVVELKDGLYIVNVAETEKRRQKVAERLKRLGL
jgi:translation elongation factor P/translation initiation factor 5A